MSVRVLSLAALLAAVLCLAGCDMPSGKDGAKSQAQEQQAPPPLVSVATLLESRNVPWQQEFQATAAGSRSAEVRARVQGIIQKRLYREGDFIKAGDLMFQLERDTYEAVYQQAQAALKNAEREWRRVKPLYAANAVSQKERDEALSSYESALAAVRQAKINLDWCQVVAPVSGFTSKEEATEGNLVSVNSLLTSINQTDPMYIDFSVAAADFMERQDLERAGRLRFPEGMVYTARLRLLNGRMYGGEGKVEFIDSQVQPETGVIRCRAVFDNAKGEIMPGQYVRIYMDGDVLPRALLVPQSAVSITGDGTYVMLLDEKNVAKRTKIEIGPAIGKNYLVLSGLESGDRIVTDGILKCRDGAPVTPAGPDGKPAGKDGASKDAKAAQDAGKASGGSMKSAGDEQKAGGMQNAGAAVQSAGQALQSIGGAETSGEHAPSGAPEGAAQPQAAAGEEDASGGQALPPFIGEVPASEPGPLKAAPAVQTADAGSPAAMAAVQQEASGKAGDAKAEKHMSSAKERPSASKSRRHTKSRGEASSGRDRKRGGKGGKSRTQSGGKG